MFFFKDLGVQVASRYHIVRWKMSHSHGQEHEEDTNHNHRYGGDIPTHALICSHVCVVMKSPGEQYV